MSETPARRAWWRSPYPWTALAGMVIVTLMRPLLRHVPDPPPVIGREPTYALIDAGGHPRTQRDTAGRVHFIGVLAATCDAGCRQTAWAMRDLAGRVAHDGLPVGLLAITCDPRADSPAALRASADPAGVSSAGWTWLTSGGDEACDAARGWLGPEAPAGQACPGLHAAATTFPLVLVDAAGNIRGRYATTPDGVDEAYWRALRVLETSRDLVLAPPHGR